jgi:CheY-like chemotaxis protein
MVTGSDMRALEREHGLPTERWLRGMPRTAVLVVDDDEAIRAAVAEILQLCGYEVVVAADGQEAVELLEAEAIVPKAIVLDLMMPRMDGWSFLGRLRGDPRFQDLPVVVTSAFAGELPDGADAWLPKPFDPMQLDRAVARLCGH